MTMGLIISSRTKPLRKAATFAAPFAMTLMLCSLSVPSLAADKNLPPYETQLRRLSSIVGALMYLDPLCNQSDPNSWHKTMTAILKAENPDDVRNRQLTDRFNQSYRTYSTTYRSCNSQARKVTSLYREEAGSILTNLQLKHSR
jgi:uncharacterized protein (TIGR02301 family)